MSADGGVASGFRSGFAAIVGRPNVGKSTLLNALLGEKVSIVSPKPQTTRNRINGILNLPEAQIIFTDTPGLSHRSGKNRLQQTLKRVAGTAVGDSDITVVVVEIGALSADAEPFVAREDLDLVTRARRGKPGNGDVILAVNKIDRVRPKSRLLPWIDVYGRETQVTTILPISALAGKGLTELVASIVARLPEGEPLFPQDLHTDRAERFLCAELVREQLLLQTHDEIPHSAAVVIEEFEDGRDEGGDLCRLTGRIYVERDSQKGIVIGKKGARIRAVSEQARLGIAELLGCRVYLRLTVHVDRRWTDNARSLRRFGLEPGGEES